MLKWGPQTGRVCAQVRASDWQSMCSSEGLRLAEYVLKWGTKTGRVCAQVRA
jgi:hypothetical protein